MFPNDDDFIDPPTISVLLLKNLVPALLEDMYYFLHTKHKNKKGVALCCDPLLYSWLLSRIHQKGPWVEFLENLKWFQELASLTVDALVWYFPTWNLEKVITSCREFRNVPLIRLQGCINYNLTLAQRQLIYPLENEHKMEVLKDFILHGNRES